MRAGGFYLAKNQEHPRGTAEVGGLARQVKPVAGVLLECFLFFLAFVFGPLVDSLLFAFLFALLALPLTSNHKFLALGK